MERNVKRKNKTPLMIRFVGWLFPKLERIAPALADKYFIYIFFTPFHYREPEKEREFLTSATAFAISVDNKHVQCYRWGAAGPKVMLVHGWAGRAGQFRKIIPQLIDAGFQVIAFDGPAHGRSEGKQTSVIGFGSVMKKLVEQEGPVHGVIAHSFGGIAALYAIAHGLPVTKLVNIASPTIASQVIGNFRRAINASEKVKKALDAYLLSEYGKPFEEFTGIHLVKVLPKPLDLLHVQDENDAEVAVENATELKKAFPPVVVHLTSGLGHTRILKDEETIAVCVNFLKS
jgi:pimeloyl-ACP methyl ester carboxylesterase